MKVFSLFLSLGLLLSNVVFAGADKGNGGGAHVCPGQVQFYDYFEGESVWKYKMLPEREITEKDAFLLGVERLSVFYPRLASSLINTYEDHISSNGKGERYNEKVWIGALNPRFTRDATNLYSKPGCEFRQLINWDERIDSVVVSKKYWDQMTNFQKGVAWFHEVLYKYTRDQQVTETSDEIRKVVAQVYSKDTTVVVDFLPKHLVSGDLRIFPSNFYVFYPPTTVCEKAGYEVSVEATKKIVVNYNSKKIKLGKKEAKSVFDLGKLRFPFEFGVEFFEDDEVYGKDYHDTGAIVRIKSKACGTEYIEKLVCDKDKSSVFGGGKCRSIRFIQDVGHRKNTPSHDGSLSIQMLELKTNSRRKFQALFLEAQNMNYAGQGEEVFNLPFMANERLYLELPKNLVYYLKLGDKQDRNYVLKFHSPTNSFVKKSNLKCGSGVDPLNVCSAGWVWSSIESK